MGGLNMLARTKKTSPSVFTQPASITWTTNSSAAAFKYTEEKVEPGSISNAFLFGDSVTEELYMFYKNGESSHGMIEAKLFLSVVQQVKEGRVVQV
ncbi:unnamed protein product [Lupinus luteus]|uniref:Uncharacterized protein n=1 Tax=Lupinus luteus TaxID=3873 RepID=A0AAV1W5W9_LUPLU